MGVGREMGKTADARAIGALRFIDVGAEVFDTGLSEVIDLIVVDLLFILVSITSVKKRAPGANKIGGQLLVDFFPK